MPSLERFFDPQIRKFDLNIRSLPGARFYFFENGTTTPKSVYTDKAGTVAHDNPVIADSNGSFAPIFLDGLYRVELRSKANIVQPGWPIDNVGQDSAVVPFGPWVEILPYNTGEVVTGSNGNWYRSLEDNNLGNDPTTSPAEWEVIPIPVASSFTSNKAYFTWSDDGDQISLDVDSAGLAADVGANLDTVENTLTIEGDLNVDDNLNVVGDADVDGNLNALSITFNNVLSTNPAKLDWYMEGFFTPTIFGGVSPGVTTYSQREGRYTRIGNVVFYTITVIWTAQSGSGRLSVGGLPHAISAAFPQVPGGLLAYSNIAGGTGKQLIAQHVGGVGSTSLYISACDPNDAAQTDVAVEAAGSLFITGFYFA